FPRPGASAGGQPRTKYSATRPRASTTAPMRRIWASGSASICSAARFQPPGATNSIRPSRTATRQRAAQRSFTGREVLVGGCGARGPGPAPGRGALRPGPGAAGAATASAVAAHVLQERVVALEHDHPIAVLERVAVRLKAALEGVERRVALRGLAVDAGGLCVALAAQPLRVALGLGQQHGALAVGFGADDPGLLLALGAQATGHLAALGAHAVIDLRDHVAVGGQVDLLEADVDHPHAQGGGGLVDALELPGDDLRALARDQLLQGAGID